MSEEQKKPVNVYEHFDFQENSKFEYTNCHFVQHTNRELMIVFGCYNPPKKNKVVAQLFLSPVNALELINNLQSQLATLKKENEGNQPNQDDPNKPRF